MSKSPDWCPRFHDTVLQDLVHQALFGLSYDLSPVQDRPQDPDVKEVESGLTGTLGTELHGYIDICHMHLRPLGNTWDRTTDSHMAATATTIVVK